MENYKRRIDSVIEYIGENLDGEIDVEYLANLAAFSPFHFHRIIRARLGEPIGAFIVRQRVQKAAHSLIFETLPISDIAYRVGYDAPSSFTKAFVKHFGVSPTEFRKTKSYRVLTTDAEKIEIKITNGKIVEVEDKTVIYISAKGDYQSVDFSAIYEKLWREMHNQQLFSKKSEALAVYGDDPNVTQESKLRTDVCLSIYKPAKPNGDVSVRTIKGGKYAVFTYTGSYFGICHAYNKIYGELLANMGVEPRSNYNIDKYLNNPNATPTEELQTEIYIPIM